MTRKEYSINQDEWMKKNNLKKGDRLYIRSSYPSGIGWVSDWTEQMDKYIGTIGEYVGENGSYGIAMKVFSGNKTDYFNFPYFILEYISKEDWIRRNKIKRILDE